MESVRDKLLPYQQPVMDPMLNALRKYRMFISGFPTGFGKTYTALAGAYELDCPVLAIVPAVAVTQWRRAAEFIGVDKRLIGVISPQRISHPAGCEFYTRDGLWKLPPKTHIIWDEPHRSASGIDRPKSPAVTTRAMAQLKAFSGVTLHPMTATLADSPMKLQALGWWAGMHDYAIPSFNAWLRRNGCEYHTFGWGRNERTVIKFTGNKEKAKQIMEGIRNAFGERFMAMRHEDIPGFPETLVDTMLVDLDAADRKKIDEAYESLSETMRSETAHSLTGSMRQRAIIEMKLTVPLLDIIKGAVEDGDSVVVFFNFTEPREYLQKLLTKDGLEFASIYGGQPQHERDAGIDAFQRNEKPIILVMSEAGGAALSLHDELHERMRRSFILPSFNAATVIQCLGRVHRSKGTFSRQYFVLAAGTVQERVNRKLKAKMHNIESFNDADFIP